MHWDGWGMHWNGWDVHWSMMLLMVLFWIAVIAGLVILVARIVQPGGSRATAGGPPVEENPLEILKRRYARGEITREEYERMRQELT